MKTNSITKVILLLAITILLVGLVSAATTNKTSTAKDTKIVKDTSKSNTKTVSKVLQKPTKKVTTNLTKKKISKKTINQSKKSASTKSYDVSDYNTLQSALTSDQYDDVNINIKSNIKITAGFSIVSPSIKTLNINGNGKTIDGTNQYAFLFIGKENSATVKNLKIINCCNLGDYGSIDGEGMAIWNKGNTIINNCTMNSNLAESGAAVGNTGTLTIANSSFNNNKAIDTGGAIINYGTLKIIKSNFNNNNASNWGGAINNKEGASLIMTDCNLSNNYAEEGAGAIENDNKLTITNCKFVANHAEYQRGGAIANDVYTANLVINGCEFNKNYVQYGYGGAICNYGNMNMTKTIFNENHAKLAGAIYNDEGTISIKNCSLNNNMASDGLGAAIYNYESNLYLTDSIIKNNATNFNEIIIFISGDDPNKISIKNNKIYIYDNNTTIISENLVETLLKNNYIIEESLYKTKMTLKLNASKIYIGSKVKATITLKDNKNHLLTNEKITLKIGGKTYSLKSNSQATATVTYKTTKTGTTKVTAIYAGTIQHQKINKTISMKVLPKIKTKLTLKLSKSKAKVKDKIKVSVTLKNKSNKAIKNEKVTIKIGSKTYTKKTSKKGTITFTYKVVKSALGKAIKATYKGNYMYLSSKASKKLLKA